MKGIATMNRSLILAVGVLAGLSFAGRPARAQALRPNIMVLLDTSGSMLYNQANDGSPLCNNNANGQTSRVYNMKNAIRAALAQVGTDEANFGLMRFPQLENTATTNCPAAHWSNGTTNNCSTSTTCTAVGGNVGCKMTTQSSTAAETTYGTWFDNGVGQAVVVPVTRASTGLKALGAADYDPVGANITSVYKWIDQSDSGMTGASNPDPELRIPPNTNTPLGRSMFYSRLYFENYVYPNDPKKACRQNVLIIATDGAETCDTGAGTSIDMTTCAQTPANSYATFNPVLQACLTRHSTTIPKGVLVYILTDNGLSTADKATANAMAAAGGTGQAIFVTLTDTNAVKQALVDIIAKTVPPAETCNGVDDNCDGQIDEGVSNACRMCTVGSGIAACGNFTIAPDSKTDPDNVKAQNGQKAQHCAVEECNCQDDNCNGQIDEGLPPNACGQPCGCAVPTEVCDGLDNNCNGDIDEGFMVGASCFNNGVGACRRGGILACKPDKSGTFCDAPTVTPQPEVCNGIDDNCNGQIDEGTLPGVGEKCGNGLGTCQSGTFVCQNGQLVCNATGMPMAEVCNGKDDNCDGVIDNGNFPETGQTCICNGLTQAQIDAPGSTCKAGHLVCRGMMGFVCEGCMLPTPEVCDGKDNNCDGMTDTQAQCPSGFGCRDGQCILQCTGGEMPCPPGYKCVNQFCIPQRCQGVTCQPGEKCDENTGSCVDLCANIDCGTKTCINGRCLDCNDPLLACTPPQLCIMGACKDDPCLNVTCPAGQYCDAGACKDLCVPGKCSQQQRCVAGVCQDDPCWNTPCGTGQFCNPLTVKCETDRCPATQCGAGMACVSQTNTCKADPCQTIRCPSDCFSCKVTPDGIGTCVVDNDKCQQITVTVGQKGGGNGCSCEVGGSSSAASPLALLLGLALVVARRRRR
jgi:MYXO-CTERM domain-containing protein